MERWRGRVAAYEASGLTRREWSRRNGVSLSALALWLKRLRSSTSLVPIVVSESEVSPCDPAASCDGTIEVTVGALRLRAGPSVDPAWLSALLKSLV